MGLGEPRGLGLHGEEWVPDGLSAVGCGRPTLADRLSARTGVCREESAGNMN